MNERNVREGDGASGTRGTEEHRAYGTTGAPGHDAPGEKSARKPEKETGLPRLDGIFEKDTSFIGTFMKIDHRFMAKCFSQMMEFGVYPGQIPVLGIVASHNGVSQTEIARQLRIKPPTVNVSVQRLEKAGILCRRQDEKDQRVSRVYLTEKGMECKQKAMARMQENERILLNSFSEAEKCLFRRFLDQILENIDTIPEPTGKDLLRREVFDK